jgi:polysaccharide pyruvyl transferase WcaK-like protein
MARGELRVGLLTTHDTNIGDDFIREGLLEVIRVSAGGRRIALTQVDKHKPHTVYPRWHPIRQLYRDGFVPRPHTGRLRSYAERWLPPLGHSRLDGCDVIIQCGTPIIWEGCAHSEWARLIWRDVMARLARRGTPILNLGGGSCYPLERVPSSLIGSADEAFVRLMLQACSLTTVRDGLAGTLLGSVGPNPQLLCCPALLAAGAYAQPVRPGRKVLVNYMRGGGHFDWGQGIDAVAWERTMRDVVSALRHDGWQVLFLAHNETERELAATIWPGLPRALPGTPQEYFDLVRDASFGVFNRMHAAVSAAGLGIPSVAIGTDSRNFMVRQLGLAALYVKEATRDRILSTIDEIIHTRDAESSRLLELRNTTASAYARILGTVLR